MNPKTGQTQGKPWHALPVDTNGPGMEIVWTRVKNTGSWANCTSADRMRLRRLPKRLTYGAYLNHNNLSAFRKACGKHDRYAREAEVSYMFGLQEKL